MPALSHADLQPRLSRGGLVALQSSRECSVVASQQTQTICITFIQCWTNVEDVGPTLYKCYTKYIHNDK